jgi:hypothetical protein
VGVANALRDTSCPISRNGNDSGTLPAKLTWRSPNQATGLARDRNALNLRTDSKCASAVIIPGIAQNKFTNRLRLSAAELNFRTTNRRYAGNRLRKRDFFCSSE